MKDPQCLRCGKMLEDAEEEYCEDCRRIPKSFCRGFPAYLYVGGIQKAIYAFKYHNQRDYAAFFAARMHEQVGEAVCRLKVDGLVPVPVHAAKKRKRGYNQAELLAIELGKCWNIPVFTDCLIREKDTAPQKELNDLQRMHNLKNAFKSGTNAVKLNKVLLVDDIYTTGATVEACSRVLTDMGVETVYYTSIAIGKGYTG